MIHRLLQQIHSSRPTMSGLLMDCLINVFPDIFKQRSDIIGGFVQQLLFVMEYIPELRPQIIQLITEKMILIDVEIEKRERDHNKNNNNNNNNDNNNDSANTIINDKICESKNPNNDMVSDDDSDSVVSDKREEDEDIISDIDDDEQEDILNANLDVLMCLMFEKTKAIAADNDNKLLIEIYQIFSRIFETSILSTADV